MNNPFRRKPAPRPTSAFVYGLGSSNEPTRSPHQTSAFVYGLSANNGRTPNAGTEGTSMETPARPEFIYPPPLNPHPLEVPSLPLTERNLRIHTASAARMATEDDLGDRVWRWLDEVDEARVQALRERVVRDP
ncbi:hypothetical protein LTR10_012903 [Elasticomyces elasticus]|nr:hypothetical protein LTR10_012903 [Elasticomyces elasticus]KAK4978674.1 hypothetical protein LTR42_001174 [Elasticomyces elasticus]